MRTLKALGESLVIMLLLAIPCIFNCFVGHILGAVGGSWLFLICYKNGKE